MATLLCASVERDDVLAQINAAVTGDTVIIPAGQATWTSTIVIPSPGKGINIVGTGSAQNPGTIIVDEVPRTGLTTGTLFSINWNVLGTTDVFTMSGIRFKGGTINTGTALRGLVQMIGSRDLTFAENNNWRIYNCSWERPWGRPMEIRAFTGLIDHCYFDMGGAGGLNFEGRLDSLVKGHESWATAVLVGTAQEGVYLEDNIVVSTSHRAFTDGFAGARFVVRHNNFTNRSVENHGTESTKVPRGGRWIACYENDFVQTVTGEYAVLYRSGSGVVFNNRLTGAWPGMCKLVYFRSTDGYPPYGQCSSIGGYDLNDATVFATGTHIGANASLLTLTVAGTPWTLNQWVDYHFCNDNPASWGTSTGGLDTRAMICVSNTDHVATFKAQIITDSATSRPLKWNTGDTFQIRQAIRALDAPGEGRGDLLTGTSDTIPPTPVAFPNHAIEGVYVWNNSGTGSTNVTRGNYYMILAGRDFFTSAHPTYTPYTYPHPLQSGTPPPPPPAVPATPSGLSASAFSSTEIRLAWTDNASDETDYKVERSLTSVGGYAQIAVLAADSVAYSDLNLLPSTQYFYRVRAHNTVGDSPYTSVANATTSGAINPAPRGRKTGLVAMHALT